MLVRKKICSKMSLFKPCQKTFPLVNDNEQGPSRGGGRGGARENMITVLLRGKMIFCYHVNRFLTVSRLSETFTEQNSNFQGENCPKFFF